MIDRYKLYNLLKEVNQYKQPANMLLALSVQERLDKAYESYLHDYIHTSIDYLSNIDDLKLLRGINRLK